MQNLVYKDINYIHNNTLNIDFENLYVKSVLLYINSKALI